MELSFFYCMLLYSVFCLKCATKVLLSTAKYFDLAMPNEGMLSVMLKQSLYCTDTSLQCILQGCFLGPLFA